MFRLSFSLVVLLGLVAPAFAQPGLPPSSRILIQSMLTSVDWQQRADAARRLGLTGDPRVLESLAMAARSDTVPQVRAAAVLSMQQIQAGGWGPGPGLPPPPDPNAALVESWYQRFLNRSADPPGLANSVDQLRRGSPPHDVVANMLLSSDEFWDRSGRTADGFVRRLFLTGLGRQPTPPELNAWIGRYLRSLRNRREIGRQFLIEYRLQLVG